MNDRIGRCDTCAHWSPAAGRTWGTCQRAGRPGALMEADGATPATLDTDPSFGCVEHEPLDDAP